MENEDLNLIKKESCVLTLPNLRSLLRLLLLPLFVWLYCVKQAYLWTGAILFLLCLLSHFPLMWIPLALMILKELFMACTGLLVIRKTGPTFLY